MTKPFDHNDREAVRLALAAPTDHDPVMQAIAAKARALMGSLQQAAAQGGLPDRIELPKPRTAVEEAAYEVFREGVKASLGERAPIIVVSTTAKQ